MPHYDLFLAHSSADKNRAMDLYQLLKPDLRVFFDKESVLPGDDWTQVIPAALRDSAATAVLVSKVDENSFYTRDEIVAAIAWLRARNQERRVVPVYLDGLPEDPTKVPYGLHHIQGIDSVVEGGLKGVAAKLKALVVRLKGAGAPVSKGDEVSKLERAKAPAEKLIREVVQLLERRGNEDLCVRLSAELNRTWSERPNTLGEALVGLKPQGLIKVINEVAKGLVGDGSEGRDSEAERMADDLAEIAEVGLAAALEPSMVSILEGIDQEGTGPMAVALPCVSHTIAELYNARLDGGSPDFSPGSDEPEGKCRLPARPSVGWDADSTRGIRVILVDIAKALGIPSEFLNDETEDLGRRVNLVLKIAAEVRRWYLLVDNKDEWSAAVELRNRCKLMELRLCLRKESGARGELVDEELELVMRLKQFFRWKARLERKRGR